MRTVFFGSPAFAVSCLDVLAEKSDVVAVVTQPDRRAGRGMKLKAPAVKERALQLGLPVHQPTRVRTKEFAAWLTSLEAELAVVVAYGRILPRAVLNAPRLGCVNIHASLLPKWRGAAPIQWAVANGDKETGVSLMQMDEGMDTGPVLAMKRAAILPDETAGELSDRLSQFGAVLLKESWIDLLAETLIPASQEHSHATHAALLHKDHGVIQWSKRAQEIHDHVRGMSPWPGAFTQFHGERIKVHQTHVLSLSSDGALPGCVLGGGHDGIRVACGDGVLVIDVLQEPGRKRLAAASFWAGGHWKVGDHLGTVPETHAVQKI